MDASGHIPTPHLPAHFDWRPVAGAFCVSVVALLLSSKLSTMLALGAALGALATLAAQAALAWYLLTQGIGPGPVEAPGEAAERALARQPQQFSFSACEGFSGELCVVPERGWGAAGAPESEDGGQKDAKRVRVAAAVKDGVLVLSRAAQQPGGGRSAVENSALGAVPLADCRVSLPTERTWSPATPLRVEHPQRALLAGARALLLYAPTPPDKERWYLALSLAAGDGAMRAGVERVLDDYAAYMGHVRAQWRLLAGATDGAATPLNDAMFLNPLLARAFFDLRRSPHVLEAIVDKINTQLAKLDTPAFVDTLECAEVHLGAAPPVITGVHAVDVAPDGSCLAEVTIRYLPPRGAHGRVTLATCLNPRAQVEEVTQSIESSTGKAIADYLLGLDQVKSVLSEVHSRARSAPLSLEVHAYALEGRLRLRIGPPPTDMLWVSFVSEPAISLDAVPTVGDTAIRASPLCKWIVERIKETVKETLLAPAEDDYDIEWMLALGAVSAAGVVPAAELLRGARSSAPTRARGSGTGRRATSGGSLVERDASRSPSGNRTWGGEDDETLDDDGADGDETRRSRSRFFGKFIDSAELKLDEMGDAIERMVAPRSATTSARASRDSATEVSGVNEAVVEATEAAEAAEAIEEATESTASPSPDPRAESGGAAVAVESLPSPPPSAGPPQQTQAELLEEARAASPPTSSPSPSSPAPASTLAAKLGSAMRAAAEKMDAQAAARAAEHPDRRPAAAEELGEKLFAGAASLFSKAAEAAETRAGTGNTAADAAMRGLGGLLNSLDIGGDRPAEAVPQTSRVVIEELDDETMGQAAGPGEHKRVPSGILEVEPMER